MKNKKLFHNALEKPIKMCLQAEHFNGETYNKCFHIMILIAFLVRIMALYSLEERWIRITIVGISWIYSHGCNDDWDENVWSIVLTHAHSKFMDQTKIFKIENTRKHNKVPQTRFKHQRVDCFERIFILHLQNKWKHIELCKHMVCLFECQSRMSLFISF